MSEENRTIAWNSYRDEFPVTKEYIYFNNAAVSPLSTRVREKVDFVLDQHLKEGILCMDRLFAQIAVIRSSAAELIGASAEEIAFIKNTTQGILLAAGSIKWEKGDNIVMPSIEFPANVYPWIALKEKGVETRMVTPREKRVTAEMLIERCDERTRFVTVSFVQFSNGYRIDLEKLGNFCRKKNIFLHVDAIQGLGALQCDVKKLKVDFLSAGGHKWLLAMAGTGIFYCRRELCNKLEVPNPGWTNVVNHTDFLDYNLQFRSDAARFEEGSLNIAGIFALGASLARFLEIGLQNVQDRILFLTGKLANGLQERGYTIASPLQEAERSGIICFTHSEKSSEEICAGLSANKAVVGLREGAIRASLHFYNNISDIDKFFAILDG